MVIELLILQAKVLLGRSMLQKKVQINMRLKKLKFSKSKMMKAQFTPESLKSMIMTKRTKIKFQKR